MAYVVVFLLISNLISDFEIASMLNHPINFDFLTQFMVWLNLEADYMDHSLGPAKTTNY